MKTGKTKTGPLTHDSAASWLHPLLSPLVSLLGVLGVLAVDSSSAAQQALPPGAVSEICGFLGQRLKGNADYLLKFDVDRFVKMVEEKKHRDWSSIGEQPGKWLEAAIEAADYTGNPELRDKAEAILKRLIAAQEPGGYLGVTDPALRTPRHPLRGMDAYELYFTLHALLTARERWGSDEALAAAKRLGDFLILKIAAGAAEFFPVPREVTIAGHPEHFGLQGTMLAHPMARLGRLAGKPIYLDWSQWTVGNIDRWSGCNTLSNLDLVAARKMRIDEIQPNVHAHTLHMNLLALLELYQATGDEGLLRKVRGAWDDIAASRAYVTGGVSTGEVYRGEFDLPNTGNVAETCATASWLLLSQRLLELTGEPVFADAIERLLWNHLPAAQAADADGWRHYTPLAGWKPEGCFTGPDCCSSSGPRVMAMVPTLLYARTPDGIAVNQFAASAARLKLASGNEVALRQVTDYPVGEKVTVEVAPARPERFALRLRLPAWCAKPALSVNGQAVADKLVPGAYAAIIREWKKDDRVELSLPMEARWVAGGHGNEGLYCLQRGPVVFALDTVWCDPATRKALVGDAKGETLPGLSGIVLDPDGWRRAVDSGQWTVDSGKRKAEESIRNPQCGLKPVATPERALGPAFVARIALADGKRALAPMLPFANIGTWYRGDAERGSRDGRRDAWAVWLPEAGSGRFRAVDLRGVANVHSNDGRGLFASPAHSAEVFPFARYGALTLRGVPFEIIDPAQNGGRNLLILRGGPAKSLASRYPAGVAIPVGFRCRALHFLGGVGGWAYPSNSDRRPAAVVRIRYEDAPSQETQWVNGEQLADYNGDTDVPGSVRALTLDGKQLRVIRIRTNPESRITQIEIASTPTVVAPVVAAVTAELPEE